MNVQNVEGQAAVHSFSRKHNGRRGAVEACGLVRRGDIITAVNDVCLADMAFHSAVRVLQLAAGEVALKFRRYSSEMLVEVGNFRGSRAVRPTPGRHAAQAMKQLDTPVCSLPEPLSATQLQQGTIFVPPTRMASRGGLSHRPSSTTTGVIRMGASRVGPKHQVHPSNIPPCNTHSSGTSRAPAKMLVASADPPPDSVPRGGLQVWAPPTTATPSSQCSLQGATNLLARFPYWQHEQVLFALFICKYDLLLAVDRLQAHMSSQGPSTHSGQSRAGQVQQLPLIRGQQWRAWGASHLILAQTALEKHGKELRLVARALSGKSVLDVAAWYYAAWKQHADYSAWKAACQAFKVQNASKDWHSEECSVCGQGGDLLCCDWCPGAFHPRCVGGSGMADAIVGTEGLDEPWMCPVCVGVFRGWRGLSCSAHALQFAHEEQNRHDILAAHWKSLRSTVFQQRSSWRGDKVTALVSPPLKAAHAAGNAAQQVQLVVQGEANCTSTARSSAAGRGAPAGAEGFRKQPFAFVMGGRKRSRARS